MSSPAEGIKDILVDASVGTFAALTGWGIFVSKQPDTPHTSITVYDSGGVASNPQWRIDFPSVQVIVRGIPGGYLEAWAKAKEVKDALLGWPSQEHNGDWWVSIAMISDIAHIGYDTQNRPELSINFKLIIEPATGTNRESL